MSRRQFVLLCSAFTVAIVIMTIVCAGAEQLSQAGQDSISVKSIVPHTGHYVLTPSKFIYTITASYSLRSSKDGFLSFKVLRIHGGRKEIIAKSQTVPISFGNGVVYLQSSIVFIKADAKREAGGLGELRVIVSMTSRGGKELTFWSSNNPLTGELSAEYKGTVSGSDYIQVLSVQPSPGSFLQAGIKSSFEIKLAYNTVSNTPVFALLRFSNIRSRNNMVYMRDYYMPVPMGRGVLTARIPLVYLPAAKRGDTAGINIVFLSSASGNAISNTLIWPYNLTR
ncbi:MAG: hypothetical protein AB9903_10155 [Vulcanimicrobiota bacterium]